MLGPLVQQQQEEQQQQTSPPLAPQPPLQPTLQRTESLQLPQSHPTEQQQIPQHQQQEEERQQIQQRPPPPPKQSPPPPPRSPLLHPPQQMSPHQSSGYAADFTFHVEPPQQTSGYASFAEPVAPAVRAALRHQASAPDPWSAQLSLRASMMLRGPSDTFNDDDPIEGLVSEAASAQPEPESDVVISDGVLSLSTRVEYSALPCGQSQDFFGLVTVKAADAPTPEEGQQTTRQPTDIVCVLDVSGSMQGDKLRQVQNAMRFIIEEADRKDRISMVTFNGSASKVLKLRTMDAQGKNDATVATLRLAASGGTSIAEGLGMALSVMEGRRQKNTISAVLLLTDGQDNCTRRQLPELMHRAARASCAVYAFGFGADHDAGLLSHIAERAHTPFTFVEKAEHISEAFAGTMGGLTSIVAQQVELTLRGNVPIKSVHTGFELRRVSDTESVVVFSDMFGGERRDILVELTVPAADAGVGQLVLLESSAQYTDLKQNAKVKTSPVLMETARVEEPQPELEPDEEVTAQRERVEVTRALQVAASHGDLGDFEGAQRVLAAADFRVRSSPVASPMSPMLVHELNDARRRMHSWAAWESGGRAQTLDVAQMHSMQRCTNTIGPLMSSKSVYSTPSQSAWISRTM